MPVGHTRGRKGKAVSYKGCPTVVREFNKQAVVQFALASKPDISL